mmetsp:Transcript_5203/g.19399  ORF Transcript_5203/g.19399 Transcript_5203/m.19399 type:complete len:255 (-) Transcript_5203:114-878(-)
MPAAADARVQCADRSARRCRGSASGPGAAPAGRAAGRAGSCHYTRVGTARGRRGSSGRSGRAAQQATAAAAGACQAAQQRPASGDGAARGAGQPGSAASRSNCRAGRGTDARTRGTDQPVGADRGAVARRAGSPAGAAGCGAAGGPEQRCRAGRPAGLAAHGLNPKDGCGAAREPLPGPADLADDLRAEPAGRVGGLLRQPLVRRACTARAGPLAIASGQGRGRCAASVARPSGRHRATSGGGADGRAARCARE